MKQSMGIESPELGIFNLARYYGQNLEPSPGVL